MATNETGAPRQLYPVSLFAERYPAFSPAALRDLIFKSTDRTNSRGEHIPGNGLEEAGAVIRIGSRVLIDEQAFFRWIADQQKQRRGVRAAA